MKALTNLVGSLDKLFLLGLCGYLSYCLYEAQRWDLETTSWLVGITVTPVVTILLVMMYLRYWWNH
jgi:membrane protein DedA with SNARE-associated domain